MSVAAAVTCGQNGFLRDSLPVSAWTRSPPFPSSAGALASSSSSPVPLCRSSVAPPLSLPLPAPAQLPGPFAVHDDAPPQCDGCGADWPFGSGDRACSDDTYPVATAETAEGARAGPDVYSLDRFNAAACPWLSPLLAGVDLDREEHSAETIAYLEPVGPHRRPVPACPGALQGTSATATQANGCNARASEGREACAVSNHADERLPGSFTWEPTSAPPNAATCGVGNAVSCGTQRSGLGSPASSPPELAPAAPSLPAPGLAPPAAAGAVGLQDGALEGCRLCSRTPGEPGCVLGDSADHDRTSGAGAVRVPHACASASLADVGGSSGRCGGSGRGDGVLGRASEGGWINGRGADGGLAACGQPHLGACAAASCATGSAASVSTPSSIGTANSSSSPTPTSSASVAAVANGANISATTTAVPLSTNALAPCLANFAEAPASCDWQRGIGHLDGPGSNPSFPSKDHEGARLRESDSPAAGDQLPSAKGQTEPAVSELDGACAPGPCAPSGRAPLQAGLAGSVDPAAAPLGVAGPCATGAEALAVVPLPQQQQLQLRGSDWGSRMSSSGGSSTSSTVGGSARGSSGGGCGLGGLEALGVAGAATPGARSRRAAGGGKTSQITSQMTAAQRTRAAVVIQAAWRGFRIRRLYLRLIVSRLGPAGRSRPDGGVDSVYQGLREFPPIPELPAISLFTLYGRPTHFRSTHRRVWFGLEHPVTRMAPAAQPAPRTPSQATLAAVIPAAMPSASTAAAGGAAAPAGPATVPNNGAAPSECGPAGLEQLPRRQRQTLRQLRIPARVEADVPMSEVERILAGGCWKDDPAGRAVAAAGGLVGGAVSRGSSGGGDSGDVGLSLYMQAKMRQEEREAEEALQMLSYEPHDLRHVLGSLKERTLERLGGLLGRTLGETLHGLPLLRGHMGGGGGGSLARSVPWPGRWISGGGGAAAGGGGGGLGAVLGSWHKTRVGPSHPSGGVSGNTAFRGWGLAAAGAPGHAGLGRGFGGNGTGDSSLFDRPEWAAAAAAAAAPEGSAEWSLRLPLLHVVDPEGHTRTEVPPGGAAIPIAVNWRRYRSRSHVTRMSF